MAERIDIVTSGESAVDAPQKPLIQVMGRGVQASAVEPQGKMIEGWAVQPQGFGSHDSDAQGTTFTIGNDAPTAPTQPEPAMPYGMPYEQPVRTSVRQSPPAPSAQIAPPSAADGTPRHAPATRKKNRIIGFIILAMILIPFAASLISAAFDAISSFIDDTTSSVSSSYESTYSGVSPEYLYDDAEKAAIEEAISARLDGIAQNDAELADWMAQGVDEMFSSSGYSLTDIGVDPQSVAQWLMEDFTYQLDGAYAYSDGTGTVYAELEMRDLFALLNEFNRATEDLINSGDLEGMSEAEGLTMLGQVFTAAMQATTDRTDFYAAFDMEKHGDEWQVVQEEWEEELEFAFGLY